MNTAPRALATRSAGDVRFRDVLNAELTKIRTLPATWIALAVAATANTVLGILAADDAIRIAGADGPAPVAQLGTLMLSPVYVFIAIAVFAGGSEYRGGQLRVTLAAVPDRTLLFATKLISAAAASLLAAAAAVLPGYLIQHAPTILHGDLSGGDATASFAMFLVVYLLLSLVGYGFAIVSKTVVTPLAVLFITPVLVSPTFQSTIPNIVKFLPHEASLSLLANPTSPTTELSPGVALITLLAWTTGLLILAENRLSRRDSQ